MGEPDRPTYANYELRKLYDRFRRGGFDSYSAHGVVAELPSAEIEKLAEWDASGTRTKLSQVSVVINGICAGVAVILIVCAQFPGFLPQESASPLPFVMLCLGIAIVFNSLAARPGRLPLAQLIAERNDPDLVPAAFALLAGGFIRRPFRLDSAPAERQLIEFIKRHASAIDPASALDWSVKQKAGIRVILTDPYFDVDLTLAALRLVPYAAAAEMTPRLGMFADRIERRNASLLSGYVHRNLSEQDGRQLIEAAREARSKLERRLAAASDTNRLLRPAQPAESDLLLRPGANCATLNQELLLRTGDIGEDG